MSVTVNYTSNLTVRETLETGVAAASRKTITIDGYNTSRTGNSASTPPVTKVAAFSKTLAAGAGTIDLTALVGTNGAAVDGTGLKVQYVKVRNPSTNTGTLTIEPGAANAYNLFGASFKLILAPGEEFTFAGYDKSSMPDVAAGAKDIKLTGTGTETSEWAIVLG